MEIYSYVTRGNQWSLCFGKWQIFSSRTLRLPTWTEKSEVGALLDESWHRLLIAHVETYEHSDWPTDRLVMGTLTPWQPVSRSFVRWFARSFVYLFIRSFAYSFVQSFSSSLVHSFVHAFALSFILAFFHSFVRALVPSFICSFIRFDCISFLCDVYLIIGLYVQPTTNTVNNQRNQSQPK